MYFRSDHSLVIPKAKISFSIRLRGVVKEFEKRFICRWLNLLFQIIPSVKVVSERRFTVEHHMNTAKHIRLSTHKKK